MKIMSGKTGAPHVTSQQFRQLVEGTVGQGSYILNSGENLEAELSSNNLLKIRSGIMSHHGNLSVVDIGTYDEVTIQNGTQGMKRIDLIVNRYTKNDETGIEENEWVVIMGTPDAESPVVPDYTEGNLQNGDLVDDCPVFEVHLDGINVTEVVSLLSVSPDIPTLNASLLSILQPTFEEIYSSSLGTIWGAKIGRIAILRWAVIAADSPVRTIRLGSKYAPAANAALPLTKNGELLGRSWFSRNTDTGMGELEYYTKSGVNETYTGWVAYITYS